jgi:RNA polymerase sigma-70 factor (ECF subfamily)
MMNAVKEDIQQRDDFELMRGIASRDQSALRDLYDRHSGIVYSLCLRILRNNAEAEELLVDVFWEAWEKCGRYDATRGSPLTYLTTLARSRAIDRLRSRASATRHMAMVDDVETVAPASAQGSDNPLGAAIDAERRATVAAALQSLEPQQRQAIECAYYEGLSHSEVAEKLGKPLGTVKTWIRTGLIRLRESLRTT